MTDKVVVCFPSGEDIKVNFMSSLMGLLVTSKTKPIHVFGQSSSRIAYNRNSLVSRAKDSEATHILFIDADTEFPGDGLDRLLKFDRDIIGATASKRSDSDNSAIGHTLSGELLSVPSAPVKMKWMGLPFMLVKIEVFNKLRQPWFAEPPWWMMGIPEKKDDPGIVPEDEYFCIRALQANYDIYCDIELSMNMGHRGAKTFKIMRPPMNFAPAEAKIDLAFTA